MQNLTEPATYFTIISLFQNPSLILTSRALLLSLTCKQRKYCFWVKFWKWRFDGFTCFECESENHIFSKWSVCICYQHNSKTNYSRIFKFGILHLYHVQMLLETFHKDRTKTLCTGMHKRILIH